MKITITRTTPTFAGPTAGVFVQWTVEAAPTDTALVFTLYRSGSPAGPFDVVMDNITDVHYEDQHVPSYSYEQTRSLTAIQREMYYRVEAAGVISEPVPVGDGLPKRYRLMRRKIQRDITKSLRVGDGIPFTVLPRKHWGIRCTTCFDRLTKSVTNSKCKVCYGTGFIDGYEGGYNLLARKGTTNVQSSVAPQGKVEINQIQLVMLDYPRISVDDVLVETWQDRRYVAKHVTRTELRGVPVHQQLVMSELARDSVEYFIPVPVGPPQEHY
jgi:hypothetical protein